MQVQRARSLEDKVDEEGNLVLNEFGTVEQVASEASYASDVDANYDGKVSIADLSVLEKDWGKSLHTGDESFLGSGRSSIGRALMVMGRGITRASSEKMQWQQSRLLRHKRLLAAVTEAVDEGAGGGLSDSPVELKEDDGLLGAEAVMN